MTIKDALINSVNYPLEENAVIPICIKRGVSANNELTTEEANSKNYELAYADVLRYVVTMVNLQQGGSVTQANARALSGTANAIYKKWGEGIIGEAADANPVINVL